LQPHGEDVHNLFWFDRTRILFLKSCGSKINFWKTIFLLNTCFI